MSLVVFIIRSLSTRAKLVFLFVVVVLILMDIASPHSNPQKFLTETQKEKKKDEEEKSIRLSTY